MAMVDTLQMRLSSRAETVECSVDDSQLCRNAAFDAEMVGSLGFQIKSAV